MKYKDAVTKRNIYLYDALKYGLTEPTKNSSTSS